MNRAGRILKTEFQRGHRLPCELLKARAQSLVFSGVIGGRENFAFPALEKNRTQIRPRTWQIFEINFELGKPSGLLQIYLFRAIDSPTMPFRWRSRASRIQ